MDLEKGLSHHASIIEAGRPGPRGGWSPSTFSSKEEIETKEAEKMSRKLKKKQDLEGEYKEIRKEVKRLQVTDKIMNLLTIREDLSEEEQLLVPLLDEGYHFQNITERVCYDIIRSKPVLLIGHTGTGKTSLIEQLAARINQPTIRANMNGQTSISDFVGQWGVKGQETYWIDGILAYAMRMGLWLIVDELDFAEAAILSVLNAVLERNGKLVLKERGNEVVAPHRDFRIIATANAAGQMMDHRAMYQGTNIMNEAFLDRFKCYIIDYMSEAVECKVIKSKVPTLPNTLVSKIVSVAHTIRHAFNKEEVQCTFSTRRLLDWAEDIAFLKEKEIKNYIFEAAEGTIFAKISTDDRDIIKGLMQRALGDVEEDFVLEEVEEKPIKTTKKMSFKTF